MQGSVMTSVKMDAVQLQGKDGRPTGRFAQTDFSGADLSGAKVSYSDFRKAHLVDLKHDGVIAAINIHMEKADAG